MSVVLTFLYCVQGDFFIEKYNEPLGIWDK